MAHAIRSAAPCAAGRASLAARRPRCSRAGAATPRLQAAPRAHASSDGGAERGPARKLEATRRDGGAAAGTSASAASSSPAALFSSPAGALFLLAAEEAASGEQVGYSKASYFTTLGLFLISFPGLYSLIKRSAKSKIERKTFEVPGPSAPGAMPLDERARALFAYFKRNNYVTADTGEVITFRGNIAPERGTAAYITFCAFIGLGSAALVLSIAQPAIGDAAYWMCGLSPMAGIFYWQNAGREETMKVKMVTSDDDLVTDILIEGDSNEIERCARELQLVEKGKIYVKGLLEKEPAKA